MTENHITSLQNQQGKAWRALRETKGRAAQRLFLAEGDHLAGEALAAGCARTLLVAESAVDKYALHLGKARQQQIERVILSDHVLAALCDAKAPQGILAVCPLPDPARDVP